MKKISLFGERTYISSPLRFARSEIFQKVKMTFLRRLIGAMKCGGGTLFFRNDVLDPIVADRFFGRGGESRGRLPGGAEGSGSIGRRYAGSGFKIDRFTALMRERTAYIPQNIKKTLLHRRPRLSHFFMISSAPALFSVLDTVGTRRSSV